MFKGLLAVLALAAPAVVAVAQTEDQSSGNGQWVLEAAPGACIIHAASPGGTVLSIWGKAGQETLSFLVQNRQWNAFEDGGRYDIGVSFDDRSAWPMQAVARNNIDKDGHGLTFAVSPGTANGGFIEQFASAGGMHITRSGKRIDSLSLSDPERAMTALATCLEHVWSAGADVTGQSAGGVVIPVSRDAAIL